MDRQTTGVYAITYNIETNDETIFKYEQRISVHIIVTVQIIILI